MTAYQHLPNLDFVRHASSLQSKFGRIPLPDTRYPHLQLFDRLTAEFFKVDRLRDSQSDNNIAIFNAPNLSAGLEAHKTPVDSWFENIASLHFATADASFDYLRATELVVYVYKASQDPSIPEPLRKEMVTCFQGFCADAHTNAATMTMARWTRHEEVLRTSCAAAAVAIVFEDKPPKTYVLQPSPAVMHLSPAVPLDTNALLVKVLEALASHCPDVSPGPRDSRVDFHQRVQGTPQEPLCLWCGKKGHLLLDCPGPAPNFACSEARDVLRVTRVSRAACTEGRQARRLTSGSASNASDDEMKDSVDRDDPTTMEATYTEIQVLFHGPTKS